MNEQFEVWMYFGEASDRVVAALGASKSYPERLSWSLLVVLLIHLNEYKLQHLPRNDAFAEKRRICRVFCDVHVSFQSRIWTTWCKITSVLGL